MERRLEDHMNLYLISQTENGDYDTYSEAVVCAPDENTARNMSPYSGEPIDWKDGNTRWGWCSSPEAVTVQFLGVAVGLVADGVVCASYHAG